MSSLEKAIADFSPLSPESRTIFFNAWKYWSVPKDYFLLREHAVSDYMYFIEKGVARIYYHKNGKEITEWIAMDEQFFLSITSYFQRTPSHLIIQPWNHPRYMAFIIMISWHSPTSSMM